MTVNRIFKQAFNEVIKYAKQRSFASCHKIIMEWKW